MRFSKKVTFALLPLFILLILLEFFGRIIFYQINSNHTLAIFHSYDIIKNRYLRYKAHATVNHNLENLITLDMILSSEGNELSNMLTKNYEGHFKKLKIEVEKVGAKMMLLYVPRSDIKINHDSKTFRSFFSNLAMNNDVDFVDMSDLFLKYDNNYTFLLPENSHLSRFGNHLISSKIKQYLNEHKSFSSPALELGPSLLYGDLEPNLNVLKTKAKNLPYTLITNSQGLRNKHEVKFPKTKKRILVFGGSITYGPYLENHEIYTDLLQKDLASYEVLNAAMIGYTIDSQLDLFRNRAKNLNPDFVLVEVTDHSIMFLTTFKRNQFARSKIGYELTFEEKRLLKLKYKM